MKFGAMQVHENAKWSNAGAVQKPEERAFKHIQGSIYGRCEDSLFFWGEATVACPKGEGSDRWRGPSLISLYRSI